MTKGNSNTKLPFHYAAGFLLFWVVLLFALVLPLHYHLPRGLRLSEQRFDGSGEFIAQYARGVLEQLDAIGPKVVGSAANEQQAVQLLLDEVAKLRAVMRDDLYELEVDLQQVSGAYVHWNMVNMYQGLQNVVVKISAKNSSSDNYLLINSHFDSKPGSPGAGDDGFMVAVMFEVLRQMLVSSRPFIHPIVFLFNGAEENPLQASHGFITQHKWAPNCRALINLDAAGSGGREILFQAGPDHPWLTNYYSKHIRHPFANTLAEEIFQFGLIPSDTDFRIFRLYGHVPGLDMAQAYNGYVYHTKYDSIEVIPDGAIQSTGDNLLALTRAFANATELYDTAKYATGHAVFFDYLGLFFVYYRASTGVWLNCAVSLLSFVLVGTSLCRIASSIKLSLQQVCEAFGGLLLLQLAGLVLSLALPMFIAAALDYFNLAMTWFANTWLVIGLYVLPTLVGLSLPTTLYFSFNRSSQIKQSLRLQMAQHAHCVLLGVLCLTLTALGIRSAYMLMLSLLFYMAALAFNLLTIWQDRDYAWAIVQAGSQVLPFLFFSYLFHAFATLCIPMAGRLASNSNPDYLIGALCVMGAYLAMGFVIPLVNIFRHPKIILSFLCAVILAFLILASTPLGFPYRERTNTGRITFFSTQRVFYDYTGTVKYNDSGYLIQFEDRRAELAFCNTNVDFSELRSNEENCDKYMMCGVPLLNHRMAKIAKATSWLPRQQPVALPGTVELKPLGRTIDAAKKTVRFDFEVRGPPQMSLFMQPSSGGEITDWSFIKDTLENKDTYEPPYHIYFSYGNDNTPLKFHVIITQSDGKLEGAPLLELGVAGHFVSAEYKRDNTTEAFKASFPSYVFIMEWPSSYQRYLF